MASVVWRPPAPSACGCGEDFVRVFCRCADGAQRHSFQSSDRNGPDIGAFEDTLCAADSGLAPCNGRTTPPGGRKAR